MRPDENLLEPACDATYGTESLAGIEIRVSRYSNYEEMRKSPTTIQKEMKSHRQRMKLKEDTLKTTSNISEVLFVKSGITHGSRYVMLPDLQSNHFSHLNDIDLSAEGPIRTLLNQVQLTSGQIRKLIENTGSSFAPRVFIFIPSSESC